MEVNRVPVRRWCVAVVALLAGGMPGGYAYATPDATADIALSASASGPAVPGQPLTWTVTATNHGPSAADSVTVTQTVPLGAGERITSAISSVGPCAVRQPGTVTCDLGRLDDGGSVRILVGQALAADRTEAATTSAIVTAGTTDAGTADNNATASAAPQRIADLWLTGSVTGADSLLGGPPTVSLQLINNGPGVIPAGVRASVTLPDPVHLAATGSSPGCTAAGQVVTCTLAGPLGVGTKSAAGLTVKGTAAPSSPLKYVVTADPPAGTTDPEPADNKATLTNAVGVPDLAVSVSGAADAVNAGTTVPLTYTVTNHGRSDVTGVVVTATLPDGFGLDSSPTGCTATGQKLTCPAVGTLAAGGSAAMVATLSVDPARPAGTALHAVRAAAAGQADPVVAYAPIAITRQANLGLSASRADGPLAAGQPVSYDVTVHNFGPATATGVVVTDRLPDAARLGSATVPAGGSCTVAGNLHACTLTDAVPVDTSVVVRITGTVSASAAGTTVTDAAFASALEVESDATDNGGSSTGVIEGDIHTKQSGQAASGGSAVRRLVAAGGRLAWWKWAGGGTVLLGLILLGIALRRSRLTRDDRLTKVGR
jgi:uncharacterized repeat protein (TIGR01451 family)